MRRLRLIRRHWRPFWCHVHETPGTWREPVAVLIALLTLRTLIAPTTLLAVSAAAAALVLATIELYWHAIDTYRDSRDKIRNRNDIWED